MNLLLGILSAAFGAILRFLFARDPEKDILRNDLAAKQRESEAMADPPRTKQSVIDALKRHYHN